MKKNPRTLRTHNAVLFTVDVAGVSVINMETRLTTFIGYPEAVVWLILEERHSHRKTIQLLSNILVKSVKETEEFMEHCLDHWKNTNLMV